jgi:branched-chain amino acid transport system permease protein
MNRLPLGRLITVLVAGFALALPVLTKDAYFIQVASAMGVAVILSLGLGLLYGYAGQMSFAHAGLYGIGAYSSVILTTKLGASFLVGLVAGIVIPGVVAFLTGIPTLRLRGHYLAIATLALQLGIVAFFVQASELTGGTVGIFGIERPSFFGISLKSSAAYYELIAVAAIIAYVLAQQIVRSRFGRALTAIREDETAATALGINPSRYKVAAFTLSAMFAGLAGTLYAYQILYINPGSFTIDWSITALSMVVIGGVGSNVGAVLGAVAVTLVRQFLFSFGDLEFLVYGIWIMVVIIFFPGGLVGIGRGLLAFWNARQTKDSKSRSRFAGTQRNSEVKHVD